MDKSLGSIPASRLKEVINAYEDDTPISFEFLVGSFFPDAFENMISLLKDAHMEGYKQAMEEMK